MMITIEQINKLHVKKKTNDSQSMGPNYTKRQRNSSTLKKKKKKIMVKSINGASHFSCEECASVLGQVWSIFQTRKTNKRAHLRRTRQVKVWLPMLTLLAISQLSTRPNTLQPLQPLWLFDVANTNTINRGRVQRAIAEEDEHKTICHFIQRNTPLTAIKRQIGKKENCDKKDNKMTGVKKRDGDGQIDRQTDRQTHTHTHTHTHTMK